MSHKPTARVLNILNLLASSPHGLTFSEIATRLSIPKSTISPILQEMEQQNFLHLNHETGLYHIGISTYCVATAFQEDNLIIPALRAEIDTLSTEIGEVCQVGILDGANVLYILKKDARADHTLQIISYVGKRLPAYATALGKALLADLDYASLQKLYPDPLVPQTEKTITDLDVLWAQLQEIRKSHIASESEEATPYLCCFAVPIHIAKKQALALSISLPLFRATEETVALIKKRLLEVKQKFEQHNLTF